MNCGRVSNQLSAYVDRELTGAEMLQIRAHLGACDSCRAEYEALGRIKMMLGRLRTAEPTLSRRSFTAHFIPDRSRFLQFQTRVKPLKTEVVNGMRVHHPKDLVKAGNRAVLFVETRFPRTFQFTKRAAIKLVTS